jgi:hypothetical protein
MFFEVFLTGGYALAYGCTLSNEGSLLGLLADPFLIEPHLTLKTQGWAWAEG